MREKIDTGGIGLDGCDRGGIGIIHVRCHRLAMRPSIRPSEPVRHGSLRLIVEYDGDFPADAAIGKSERFVDIRKGEAVGYELFGMYLVG